MLVRRANNMRAARAKHEFFVIVDNTAHIAPDVFYKDVVCLQFNVNGDQA